LTELDLPLSLLDGTEQPAVGFPVFVTREFVSRMEIGNTQDPLLLQVLPRRQEAEHVTGFSTDPLREIEAQSVPGLLHKYQGRALLMVATQCAINCRYCFRRHFPYDELPKGIEQFAPALAAIAADESVEEVILSGGDPLMLVDEQLQLLATRIQSISHVRRLRIHTRLPITIPSRVGHDLLDWIRHTQTTVTIVIHSNHVREFDSDVDAALARLSDAGIPLLNQTVLLQGVNDTTGAQVDLARHLINNRVIPYYLHQLDRVNGTAHFECPAGTGQRLIKQLHTQLPGYAVPRLVRELPGQPGKSFVA